ncbi:LamG-like jellyroll fold domain-containing protein [Nitrospirillum amazonense]|uniref:LamG-like jellyroll fold domain-containing protein n=1 Tax=Nitrospirillum amazonense TaxID=28077 RepID=UPI002412D4F8|nr:LamG-like jellyroll fold domain-containing protein [Nitrospirillum amazonense]MDG3443268.1 hypothetical protein [Nitrospirillum amazonense]
MTDLATQVAGLTTSVNALTSAVNVAKATLDASVSAAGTSATTAQAAVTTAASSATIAQAAQAAAVAVSGLSSLNSFLGQIQAGAPAAVFWYDTTRDSDGGAWRKRCTWQSWVTEAASSTRGSRASFPGQALIVVVGSTMIIYDADQATPAMWMVFNSGGAALATYNMVQSPQAVFARDGHLWGAAGGYGLIEVDFISDRAVLTNATTSLAYATGIASRNAGAGYTIATGRGVLTNTVVNAVAATVLPGAPIDRSTGMPRPTVAVGTGFYLDIIGPFGGVTYPSSSAAVTSVAFDAENFLHASDGTTVRVYHPTTLAVTGFTPIRSETVSSIPALLGVPTGINDIAARSASGLALRAPDPINPASGMVACITGSANIANGGGAFNTGWLVGDCRLALSSTSTASVTGANIATWTSSAGTTGWTTTDGNLTLSISGSDLQIAETASTVTASKAVYQLSGCVVGQTYLVALTMRRGTVGAIMRSEVTDNGATVPLAGGYTASTTASTVFMQFRATDTSPKVRINFDSPYTAGQTGLVTSLSVDLIEPDRSVAAVGVRPVGTLTKSLVATTADLSAIGGFSTSNYLEQPYTAALDFGTGDFMLAAWINPGGGNETYVTRCSSNAYDAGSWGLSKSAGALQFDVFSVMTLSMASVPVGVWAQVIACRRSGCWELWYNGMRVAASTTGGTTNLTAAAHVLRIGLGATLTAPLINSIAQLRISATAPTPEQIARMYADERPLFQPGAKCVLGGTSAAVQGLAHDPDTGALYAAKSDGTSVFQGLVRTAHLTGLATTSNSDNHSAVAARQGGYVIATANQAVASQPAITFRDRILADRVPVAPIDANRVVFPVVATTDATPTVIARLPVAEGDELQLFVDVEATEYGATPTERMGYQRRARVYRLPNGNVTVAAVQTLATDYESATTTCDVTVVAETASQTVCVQATGVAGKRLAWATLVHINRSGATRYAA